MFFNFSKLALSSFDKDIISNKRAIFLRWIDSCWASSTQGVSSINIDFNSWFFKRLLINAAVSLDFHSLKMALMRGELLAIELANALA